MQITIRSDATIAAFRGRMTPERLRMALSVGVNATAKQAKTFGARAIAKASSIKRGDVDRGMALRPYATPASLEARVIGFGKPLSLKSFGAYQTAKGVKAVVWGKAQFYKSGFRGPRPGAVAPKLGGHSFIRQGAARLPLHKLYGAGVAQVMGQADTETAIRNHAAQRLDANIARQLARYAYAG